MIQMCKYNILTGCPTVYVPVKRNNYVFCYFFINNGNGCYTYYVCVYNSLTIDQKNKNLNLKLFFFFIKNEKISKIYEKFFLNNLFQVKMLTESIKFTQNPN